MAILKPNEVDVLEQKERVVKEEDGEAGEQEEEDEVEAIAALADIQVEIQKPWKISL